MLINLRCPSCGQLTEVRIDEDVEDQIECAACGAAIGLPSDLKETWRGSSHNEDTGTFPKPFVNRDREADGG